MILLIIDSLLSMRLTLPIAIHYTIKDHKFIKNKIFLDEITEKKYINMYVNYNSMQTTSQANTMYMAFLGLLKIMI